MFEREREMRAALAGAFENGGVAAVYTSKNEADILDLSLRHMLGEGVGLILVADGNSDDDSREILDHLNSETGRVWWFNDQRPYHYQPELSEAMADIAGSLGATWIIPADVDQFYYSTDGRRISDRLADYPGDKLRIENFVHLSVGRRVAGPPGAGPKVAFRYRPGVRIANGVHDCSLPGGEWGILETRELHYRSFEHFCRKAAERDKTLEPVARARGDGDYHPKLNALSDEEKREWWVGWCAQETLDDPIPLRL